MQAYQPQTTYSLPTELYHLYELHLEQECIRLLKENQHVDITQVEKILPPLPPLIKLVLALFTTLLKKSCPPQDPYLYEILTNPLMVRIKLPIIKLIASLIEKKLFTCQQSQKWFEEISHALLYKQLLFSPILSILTQNTQFLAIDKFLLFANTLVSPEYKMLRPIQIYQMYEGGLFTIESSKFKKRLIFLIHSLGKTLTTSESLVTRNIDEFKKNKERSILLQDSIRITILSKNKENLTTIVDAIVLDLFQNKEYLKKQQFLYLLQIKKPDPLLYIILDLVRAELMLIQQKFICGIINQTKENAKTNFYATEMSKILNKCPFNGDQRCDCKKCQCVRRNRESAKLSQQKKRNAVQQLQPLKIRIADLQNQNKELSIKNVQLQQQNMMLKEMLSQMKEHPSFKGLLMETIEPVSKILNNQI